MPIERLHRDAMLAPLKFAARNDCANVARLAGFEALAMNALAQAPNAQLEGIVRGFEAASLDDKKARVRVLLALLEGAPAPAPPTIMDPLALHVTAVKGIGPKRAAALIERGLVSVGDVLFTLPRAWEDRRATRRISELEAGVVAVVSGTVAASGAVGFGGRGRRYEVLLDDGSGTLRLVFFHFRLPEMQKRFPKGTVVTASGEVARYGPRLQMAHPRVGSGVRVEEMGGVQPVYPEILGMHPLDLARAAQACLSAVEAAGGVPDPLPASVRAAGRVMGLGEALRVLHTPLGADVSAEALRALVERRSPAHRRLAFEELFVLATALALRRRSALVEPAPALDHPGEIATLESTLPFAPTAAQRRVVGEIAGDLARPVPMARLLQGDVGSGKTAVAAAACLRAVRCGHQAAFMAPTELLAEQHGRTLKRLFSPLGVRVEVITGSLGKKARAVAEARLRNRDLDIAVGTQALLSEGVAFARLGLCIADEQHRFGVVQRAALRAKTGDRRLMPHLLVMTATPIPRSLALTVYGDLAVSVLDELPPGRTPVATRATTSVDDAHAAIKAAIARDERVFVVHPLIDESDVAGDLAAATASYRQLGEMFGDTVALMHGRMPAKERDAAMTRFLRGDARVLVSTTVIEVGVDVPEATLMVVMNAERFGLAQLHQLRGRVGRSARKSECVLVVMGGGEDAQKRVQALCDTNDGFRIAEEDLMLRGPGDVLGTRQSGLPSLAFSDLVRHAPLIEQTRQLADDLVARDPALADSDNAGLRRLVHERYAARLALTTAG